MPWTSNSTLQVLPEQAAGYPNTWIIHSGHGIDARYDCDIAISNQKSPLTWGGVLDYASLTSMAYLYKVGGGIWGFLEGRD